MSTSIFINIIFSRKKLASQSSFVCKFGEEEMKDFRKKKKRSGRNKKL